MEVCPKFLWSPWPQYLTARSTHSSASWSTSVCIFSEASGLCVELSGAAKPSFTEIESEGRSALDIAKLHAAHLPSVIDLSAVVSGLKSVWEGAWERASLGGQSYTLSNPVFNRHGDLLVQLGLLGARQTVYGTPHKRRSVLPPKLALREC